MAIKIEFEKQDRAIELPDGTVLDIPERTKNNNDKIQEILQSRLKINEYDFLVEILKALFGEKGFKKIAPKAESANLDFLTAVYTKSIELFYADKSEAERTEVEKRAAELDVLTDKFKGINPILDTIK